MQAQRLDRRAGRNGCRNVDVIVVCEQIAGLFQLIQFAVCLAQLFRSELVRQAAEDILRTFLRHTGRDNGRQCIGRIVDNVHRSTVDVHQDIDTLHGKTMYHKKCTPVKQKFRD